LTPDDERLARRRAKERRICRRRLLISGAALGALAVGAGAAALVVDRSSERESVRPPPPPPPQIGYSGSKLAPRTKARPRRSLRPSEAEQRQAVARFAELGLPILCGGNQGRFVALTFDDGPGPYTDLAMRILRRRGVRATFVLVGSRVELFPSLPAREAAFGALGDHTWTHRYLPTLPDAAVRREISSTLAIVGQTSEAPVLLFRPPYGGRTRRIDRIVRSFGLVQVLWSVDSRDSTGARVKGIYRNVLAGLKPGAIILMHENRARTIKSLIRYVLTAIRKRHYKMVTIPELLALDPPTVEQVRKRQC
jgi:peptidoglycan/xylan/chitin deacetylase (PgdA/CDA1 family)